MKKTVKVKTAVNWFYGNYCTRKCWNDDTKLREHWEKLQQLANKHEEVWGYSELFKSGRSHSNFRYYLS